jgi:hypothetical protein
MCDEARCLTFLQPKHVHVLLEAGLIRERVWIDTVLFSPGSLFGVNAAECKYFFVLQR